jgi:hypothetical protein
VKESRQFSGTEFKVNNEQLKAAAKEYGNRHPPNVVAYHGQAAQQSRVLVGPINWLA